MLNPNGPTPSPAKKQAMQKRLNKTQSRASENQANSLAIDNYFKKYDQQKKAEEKNSANMGKMIDEKVKWGKDNPGPAYKPAELHLSKKQGPHDVWNPKAQIDNSQVQDREQSDSLDHFITRMVHHKTQTFMEQYLAHHPNSNKSLPDPISHDGEVITGVGVKGKGTKNKEALLARLRNKK